MSADGVAYNVEVAIVEWQYPTDREPKSDTGWEAQLRSFRNEVVADCRASKTLRGSYSIWVKNPLESDCDSRAIKQKMRDYIQRTRDLPVAPTQQEYVNDRLIFEITKNW